MGNGTSLGRVRGLGSAKEGPHHWLLQRFTAVGNFILLLYFAFELLILPNYSFETFTAWLSAPVPAIAMALLVISVFWHARLGMQVMIEDYVHTPGSKFAAIVLLNLLVFGGVAAGLFFIFLVVTHAAGADVATKATHEAVEQASRQVMQSLQQMMGGHQ